MKSSVNYQTPVSASHKFGPAEEVLAKLIKPRVVLPAFQFHAHTKYLYKEKMTLPYDFSDFRTCSIQPGQNKNVNI